MALSVGEELKAVTVKKHEFLYHFRPVPCGGNLYFRNPLFRIHTPHISRLQISLVTIFGKMTKRAQMAIFIKLKLKKNLFKTWLRDSLQNFILLFLM